MSSLTFYQSTKGAELYTIEISELDIAFQNSATPIPQEYADLEGAFSEDASNGLSEHKPSDMNIEIEEGEEPRNMGLRPMSPIEL